MKPCTAVVAVTAALLTAGCTPAIQSAVGSTASPATLISFHESASRLSPPTTSPAAAYLSDADIAEMARRYVLARLGMPPDGNFADVTGNAWAPYITTFAFHAGVLRVHLEIDRNSLDGEGIAKKAAKAVAKFVRTGPGSEILLDNVDRVESEAASGVVIAEADV